MKHLKKFTLAVISFALLLSSCSKPGPEPKDPPKVYKMSSQAGSETFFKMFTYDIFGRISSIDLEDIIATYSYDANGKVQTYEVTYDDESEGWDGTLYYETGSNKIDYIITEFPPASGFLKDSSVFDYHADRVSTITHYTYVDVPGVWQGYTQVGLTEYTYDLEGNVLTETKTLNGDTEVFEYTYDDKLSPWPLAISNQYDPLLGPISTSNIISLTCKDGNNQIDQDESFTATYTYNGYNYPVTGEFTFLNGTTENYTFDYK